MTARQQFIATLFLGVAFLVLFRQLDLTSYHIGLMMRCMILMIVTIGLNILIGHAGLVSLGQAALYGLGAYVAAWLAAKQGVQFLPAIIAGVVVTGVFGAVLAYPPFGCAASIWRSSPSRSDWCSRTFWSNGCR